MMRFLASCCGFLVGAIPSAYLIGRMKGIDIRTKGSGNPGTTNAFRTMGLRAGVFTFVCDFFKGVLGCIMGLCIDGASGALYAGVFTVVGHCYSPYLHFRGGKGVATSAAILLFFDWRLALINILAFFVTVSLTRIISLSSIVAALINVVGVFIFYGFREPTFLFWGLSGLVLFRHSANIRRLLRGVEPTFQWKQTGRK